MWFNRSMTCAFKTIALIGKYQSPEVAEAVLASPITCATRGWLY